MSCSPPLTLARERQQKYKSSGIDKFKNFISDFWNYDQKMQNKISGGLLAKIFEIRARLVRTFPTSNISISEHNSSLNHSYFDIKIVAIRLY